MFIESSKNAIEIIPVTIKNFSKTLSLESQMIQNWVEANQFTAKPSTLCLIPGTNGTLKKVYLGVSGKIDETSWAVASEKLPAGDYYTQTSNHLLNVVAWGRAQYQFERYKQSKKRYPNLVLQASKYREAKSIIEAIFLVRDLINTPCEDLGPKELAQVCAQLAVQYDALFKEISGDDLLVQNFPAVHTVGRAALNEPRLIELSWGESHHPHLCLVGKGVCFDSGGLDIKPGSNMLLMKKDMGGAAHVLGLAQLIMSLKLSIRLTVIIPAVENAISGNAYRPGDVVHTRKGLTVEVGNTDAEGRVILADALSLASEKKPDLIIDFATLTGAARVAVGTDIAAMFTNDESVSEGLLDSSEKMCDPVWRLPLHQPYKELIKGSVADISNTGSSVYGGAITAALFLEHFVSVKTPWAHFDIMAWNSSSTPGRPKGGEALGLLACFDMLKSWVKTFNS